MKPVRVAVVGVGSMGYHHARVYRELSRTMPIELVGVVDANYERARRVAFEFNTKAFASVEALLREGVDAASIAVPTSLHRDIALELIEDGVHVLVEKPIADTLEKALEIVRAAEKQGVILLVGHIERFNPAVQMLREILMEGELGEPITISAKRVGPFVQRISDTGVIVDLAVHDIDVMNYLLGRGPSSVYAKARNIKHPSGFEDYALIMLSYDNLVDGIIEVNRLTPYKARQLTVVGTRGIAELDYISQSLRIYNERYIKEARVPREEPLKRELRHFIECVTDNKKPLVSGAEGVLALQVALAAIESYRSGRVVKA